MKSWLSGLALLCLCMAGKAAAQPIPVAPEWTAPIAPFRIIGNIYYVGTQELAVYLIVGPKGDILLDGSLAQNAPLIEHNIAALGFDIHDVKILLNSHAHFDHAGALAQLKRDSGAILVASAGDKPILERGHIGWGPSARNSFPPVTVDHVVPDGGTVMLGGTAMTAHLTPGHTPGCTSWTMPVRESGARHRAIFYCSTSVAGNPLVGNKLYPNIVADYRASFAKLRKIDADVFLGAHASFFHLQRKRAAMKPGARNPFVDPGELQDFVAHSEADFDAELARQQAAANAR